LTTQQIIEQLSTATRPLLSRESVYHPSAAFSDGPDANGTRAAGATQCHDVIGTSVPVESHVLIVDDSALYRECLLGVLATRPGVAVHGTGWDPASLLAGMQANPPDVIVLNGSARHSASLIGHIRQINPAVRVIVTGMAEHDEGGIVACAEAGAAAFHLRTESLAELLVLIHAIADGRPYCSPTVSTILLRHMSLAATKRRRPTPGDCALTAREMQILEMLESGLANRDIADRLCIALHTVKNHVHNILTKLDVNSREQAGAFARNMRSSDRFSTI
jgi:DNA-binding NarL/FixJ family response regulator